MKVFIVYSLIVEYIHPVKKIILQSKIVYKYFYVKMY